MHHYGAHYMVIELLIGIIIVLLTIWKFRINHILIWLGDEIGKHRGLKILWAVMPLRVRFSSELLNSHSQLFNSSSL